MIVYDLLCIAPTDAETRVVIHDRYYKTLKISQIRNPIFIGEDPSYPDLEEYLDDEICEWYLDKTDTGDPEIHLVLPWSQKEHQAYMHMVSLK